MTQRIFLLSPLRCTQCLVGLQNISTRIEKRLSCADNYTLLIKSDSEVARHQPQLLGVYRLVDTYNDRWVGREEGRSVS